MPTPAHFSLRPLRSGHISFRLLKSDYLCQAHFCLKPKRPLLSKDHYYLRPLKKSHPFKFIAWGNLFVCFCLRPLRTGHPFKFIAWGYFFCLRPLKSGHPFKFIAWGYSFLLKATQNGPSFQVHCLGQLFFIGAGGCRRVRPQMIPYQSNF